MKRCGLVLAAGGAIVLAGAVCYRWSRAPRTPPSPPATVGSAPKENPGGDAAWRYRLSQPRHWRYLLLNQ